MIKEYRDRNIYIHKEMLDNIETNRYKYFLYSVFKKQQQQNVHETNMHTGCLFDMYTTVQGFQQNNFGV